MSEDPALVELVARAMVPFPSDPDGLVFMGQLLAGPRGSVCLPDEGSALVMPAWRALEYDAIKAIRALREAGYLATPDDKAR